MLLTLKDIGALVDHNMWGRGKVVDVTPPYATIHFASLTDDTAGPRRKLQENSAHLSRAHSQSDPVLDLVSVGLAAPKRKASAVKKGKTKAVQHSLDQAIDWFAVAYPRLFADPRFMNDEVKVLRDAHDAFTAAFGEGRGEELLAAGSKAAIARAFDSIQATTAIPTKLTSGVNDDRLRRLDAASHLLDGVLAFVKRPEDTTFAGLVESVATLPSSDSAKMLTWPNVTILPSLADPARFMVIRPGLVERMAARMEFHMRTTSSPTWTAFETIQRMHTILLQRLVTLGAKDFLDADAFVRATHTLE